MDEIFEAMIATHGPLVRRTARRFGRGAGADTADDIAQDVYLAVWQQVRRGVAIEFPTTYLYRTTMRAALRAARRDAREVAGDEVLAAAPAAGPSPEDVARRRQARARVSGALRRLPRERRLAAVQHLAGRSVAELMAETGWSYQKARNLVARGVGDLRRTLAAH